MHNLKLAFRTLFKSPFVTGVAIVSLALGIGANAAIFSLFNQMLLQRAAGAGAGAAGEPRRARPEAGIDVVQQRGRLRRRSSATRCSGTSSACSRSSPGSPRTVSFGANLAYKGQTQNGEGMLVSGSYFGVLGVQPALGRLLTPDDDKNIGGHFVTVLSHRYWTTQVQSGSQRPQRNDHRQRPGHDDRRRRARRASTARRSASRPQVFVPITMRGLMEPGFTALAKTAAATGPTCSRG